MKLTRRDSAMQILPGLVVHLTPPDHQLVFLKGYIELVTGKTCDRQRDAQMLGLFTIRKITTIKV